MDYVKIILNAMEAVVGVEPSEMMDALDLPLFDNGILDSLSLPMVLTNIESQLNIHINIREMKPSDFYSVNKLAEAINRIIAQ